MLTAQRNEDPAGPTRRNGLASYLAGPFLIDCNSTSSLAPADILVQAR